MTSKSQQSETEFNYVRKIEGQIKSWRIVTPPTSKLHLKYHYKDGVTIKTQQSGLFDIAPLNLCWRPASLGFDHKEFYPVAFR